MRVVINIVVVIVAHIQYSAVELGFNGDGGDKYCRLLLLLLLLMLGLSQFLELNQGQRLKFISHDDKNIYC